MSDTATISPAAAPALASAARGLNNTLVMTARSIRLSSRNVDAIFTSLMLPIMLMLIFVYLFGGAISTGTGEPYVSYVVPGVLLLCAGFGSSGTAVGVTEDMKGGIIDRLRSLDVGGASILAGHVASSTVRNTVSTVLVLGVALLIGFRPSPTLPGALTAAGLLLAFIVAISWLAAAVGLLTKSPEAAGAFSFFMMFLTYPSSTFAPIDTMPTWIHGFAYHQPVTPVIESLRGLFLNEPVGADPWIALAWCTGILLTALGLSDRLFRNRTA